MQKYVGKTVKTAVENPKTGETVFSQAVIISQNYGTPVLKFAYGIDPNFAGRIIFPDIPQDLRAKPTLAAKINSKNAGKKNNSLIDNSELIGKLKDVIACRISLNSSDAVSAGQNKRLAELKETLASRLKDSSQQVQNCSTSDQLSSIQEALEKISGQYSSGASSSLANDLKDILALAAKLSGTSSGSQTVAHTDKVELSEAGQNMAKDEDLGAAADHGSGYTYDYLSLKKKRLENLEAIRQEESEKNGIRLDDITIDSRFNFNENEAPALEDDESENKPETLT